MPNAATATSSLIPKHGGYRKLKSFQVAELIHFGFTTEARRHGAG